MMAGAEQRGERGRSRVPVPLPPAEPSVSTRLGLMQLDRTSFDETDSFQVDQEALESADWAKNGLMVPGYQPIMMRNGKVRRRLRWRPKAMMKRKRPPRVPPPPSGPRLKVCPVQPSPRPLPDVLPHSGARLSSSSASVASASNASQTSKTSKVSMHSLASVETTVKSNTERSRTQRFLFPLNRPRPSDSSEQSTDTVSTIGSEYSRTIRGRSLSMTSSATIDDSIREEEPPTPRTSGIPPLFRMRAGQNRARASSDPFLGSPSPPMIPRAEIKQYPVPQLADEDLERTRRVDLRIRKQQEQPLIRRHSFNVPQSALESGSTENIMSISELRLRESPSIPVSMSCPVNQVNKPPMLPMHALPSSRSSAHSPPGSSPTADSQRWINEQNHMMEVDPILSPTLSTESPDENTPTSCASPTATKSIATAVPETPSTVGEEEDTDDEIRFSMFDSFNMESLLDGPLSSLTTAISPLEAAAASSAEHLRKPSTVPVDLDDGGFLEAEKNLQAIHDMASEHLQQGEYDEALEVFEEILRGQLARYGKDHFRVGTALHNIGIVHMKRMDYEKATIAYREAVAVRKIALGEDHADVAVSLAQLGVAFLERKQHKKAISSFREALRIRRRCLGAAHPKVAKILNNIGCALYELNALEVAKVAFEEALDIQRQNLRDHAPESQNESNSSLLSVASTLSNIASIKLLSNNFDAATVDLQEALLIQQCVFGDDHPVPKQTEESLRWIERSRRAQARPRSGGLELFSKLLGGSITGQADPLSCTDGTESASFPDDSSLGSRRQVYRRSTSQGVLDTVERRFAAFQASLDFACGEKTQSVFDEYEYEERIEEEDSVESEYP